MGLKSDRAITLTVVDGLLVLLSMALIYSQNPFAVPLEPFLMAYCMLRVMFMLSRKWTTNIMLFLIAAFCVYELFVGYTQLFGGIGILKGQDNIKGSFSCSGPLGCFLSVCTSLSIALYTRSTIPFIRISSAVLAISSFVLMACTLSRASMLSLGVSMLFLAMKSEKTVSFILKNIISISVAAILLGAGAYLIKKPSADGRIMMVRIGLRIMKENGLCGVGLGRFAGAYGNAQASFFQEYTSNGTDDMDTGNIPENLRMIAGCPAYCFNEYLRIGIEAGPVSMLLLICLVTAGVLSAYKTGSIWCYPLISISVFACFSYPFEVGALTFLMIVCLASNGRDTGLKSTCLLFFSLMFVLLGTTYYSHKTMVKRAFPGTGLSCVERFCVSRCKVYMVHDSSLLPDGLYDEKTLFVIGQTLNRDGEYSKSDSILRLGAEISSDPMFWNLMGSNSLAQGNFREAEQRYKHAFMMVPNRIYPLCLLAKLYYMEGDTIRFHKMAERVETFRPKVESATTERLRTEIRELKSNIAGRQKR